MNTRYILIVFSFLISVSCITNKNSANSTLNERQIKDAAWNTTKLSNGIKWKHFHFNKLFSAKQYITLFEINLNKDVGIDIPFVSEGFMKTSDFAIASNDIFAINGGFFDTFKGGSVVFSRKDSEIINQTKEGFHRFRENAGFLVDKSGKISIIQRPSDDVNGWESIEAQHLLTSRPILIDKGKPIEPLGNPSNTNRHPRTAIGITKDNYLICLTVDGRSPDSYGMSIVEEGYICYLSICKTNTKRKNLYRNKRNLS